MVTIRQLSATDVLDDGYQIAVWGAPTGDTRRASMSTVANYLGIGGNITLTKLTMQSDRILGRATAGDGAIQELTVGGGLTLTAGDLSADVVSVNGKTGDVVLTAADVNALPASTTYVASVVAGANVTIDDTDPSAPIVSADVGVTSVQGHTGAVVIGLKEVTDEYDVGGVPAPLQALAVYKEADLGGKLLQATVDDDGNPIVVGGVTIAGYATSGTPTNSTIPAHGPSGRLRVGTPSAGTDATTKTYVDNLIDARLTAAQRNAIDALTSGSTAADIVAALQAI